MWTSLIVLLIAAALTAAAAFWVLFAYRRAGGGKHSPRDALLVTGAVTLVGLGAYLAVGRPELPDAPYQARLEALRQRDLSTYSVEEALVYYTEAAKADPNNPVAHLYLGEILLRLGRPREAARAFDQALRREPRLADAMMGLGIALSAIDGRTTPDALALFQQAGQLTNDPRPWLYQAMAAMEEGRDAREFWREALARMPPDDPRREMAQRFARGERR